MKSNLATEMCKAKFRRPLSEESITTNLVSIFVASEMRGRIEMRSVIDPRIFNRCLSIYFTMAQRVRTSGGILRLSCEETPRILRLQTAR